MSKDQQGIIRLEVPVELPAPRFVVAVQGVAVQSEEAHLQHDMNSELLPCERMVSLSTLPPLLLEILLPPNYPLYDPPQIVSMHAMQSWLPLARLHRILMDKWEAGEGVLFTWIECVRSGEFLGILGLTFSRQGNEYIKCVIFTCEYPSINIAPYVGSRIRLLEYLYLSSPRTMRPASKPASHSPRTTAKSV